MRSTLSSLSIGVVILSSLPWCLWAEKDEASRNEDWRTIASPQVLEECVAAAELPFEVEAWENVTDLVEEYSMLSDASYDALGDRMDTYLPLIVDSLSAHGLPVALQYLPVAESRLHVHISSPSGAKGLWQFMRTTARHCGLEVNANVDERMDPAKSTQAAIQLLENLYAEFHEWSLVLAAYNCGPAKVRKAIKATGGDNFWEISRYLPSQTRRYIPSFIAAACATEFHRRRVQQSREPVINSVEKDTLSYVWTDPWLITNRYPGWWQNPVKFEMALCATWSPPLQNINIQSATKRSIASL